MIGVPQVMVSSTFYDLKQVRADLARFLSEEIGCRPVISELPSFPIDPDVDTVNNCRRRVEIDADILVLVIGGRYGSVDTRSAKSVTNLEYLAARAKGIPVYAFVERRILSVMPVWKANKEADFSGVVEDTRVFAFIEEVRDLHKVWMAEFELAEEIVNALRWRLAHLALRGAQLVKRAHDSKEYTVISQLQGPSLRLALERPRCWEYKLFAELLIQEVATRRALAEQKRLGLAYGSYDWISDEGLMGWTQARGAELENLVHAFSVLINQEIAKAFGPPGQPADLELILFTARSIATLYQEAIDWSLRIRRTVGEEGLKELVESMQGFTADIVTKIENFGPHILRELEAAMAAGEAEGPRTVRISLNLDVPGIEEAMQAVRNLVERAKRRQVRR